MADISQEVFSDVAKGITRFRRDESNDSFRGWMWTITRNKINDYYRRLNRNAQPVGGTDAQVALQQMPEQLDDENDQDPLTASESPVHRALELIRIEFEDRTWQAFWAVTVDGRAPADVAVDLGMKRMAVYKAKSRVLAKLREELEGLVEL